MSTGTVSMFDPEPMPQLFEEDIPAWEAQREEARQDLNRNFAKDVIFQQLDMHPILSLIHISEPTRPY